MLAFKSRSSWSLMGCREARINSWPFSDDSPPPGNNRSSSSLRLCYSNTPWRLCSLLAYPSGGKTATPSFGGDKPPLFKLWPGVLRTLPPNLEGVPSLCHQFSSHRDQEVTKDLSLSALLPQAVEVHKGQARVHMKF